jgi:hypothetical protein
MKMQRIERLECLRIDMCFCVGYKIVDGEYDRVNKEKPNVSTIILAHDTVMAPSP